MKFYSEQTKQFYDSENECIKAEKAAIDAVKKAEIEKKAKNEARALAAKEVEEALKAVQVAREHYNEVLTKFCKEYGSWHYSISEPLRMLDICDLFDLF